MATATAPEITVAPAPALKLAPARGAEAPTRPRPATALSKAARQGASNDDYGDVAGVVGGTGILLIQACAVIPGLLPIMLLAAVFALPLVLPVVALGLVGSVVIGPPVLVWRGVSRAISRGHA
jgi:hypothetical protein